MTNVSISNEKIVECLTRMIDNANLGEDEKEILTALRDEAEFNDALCLDANGRPIYPGSNLKSMVDRNVVVHVSGVATMENGTKSPIGHKYGEELASTTVYVPSCFEVVDMTEADVVAVEFEARLRNSTGLAEFSEYMDLFERYASARIREKDQAGIEIDG